MNNYNRQKADAFFIICVAGGLYFMYMFIVIILKLLDLCLQ